jgi:hypothetical protein
LAFLFSDLHAVFEQLDILRSDLAAMMEFVECGKIQGKRRLFQRTPNLQQPV